MEVPTTLTLALMLLQTGCGLLGGDPKEPELEPGRRDYVWKVDSVYSAPGGWMNTIWGSSPNDVWMASGAGLEKVWHFDGEAWTPYSKRLPGSFFSIYGFGQDNVWMGSSGDIYHYNGIEWKRFFVYDVDGMGEPWVRDVWGTSVNDIYGIGNVAPESGTPFRGFVLHFDGTEWKEVLVTDFGVQLQIVRQSRQGVFVRGIKPTYTGT